MNEVVGQLAPLALGVAVSPVPVIAVILVLMGPRPRVSGPPFLLGWVVGVALAVSVFALLGGVVAPDEDDGSRPVLGTVKVVLGLALLALAVRQWRARPRPGAEPALPGWMAGAGAMGPGRAAAVAFALAALNPKNLLLAASGGALVAGAPSVDDVGSAAVAVVVFTVIASLSVGVPVILSLVAPRASAQRLDAARGWLTVNNGTVMTVLFLVLGTVVLGQGVAAF